MRILLTALSHCLGPSIIELLDRLLVVSVPSIKPTGLGRAQTHPIHRVKDPPLGRALLPHGEGLCMAPN